MFGNDIYLKMQSLPPPTINKLPRNLAVQPIGWLVVIRPQQFDPVIMFTRKSGRRAHLAPASVMYVRHVIDDTNSFRLKLASILHTARDETLPLPSLPAP